MKLNEKYFGKLTLILTVIFLSSCGGESDQSTDSEGDQLDNTQEVLDFYAANPQLITFATLADLPDDLNWEDGADLPEIGSPNAKKGGTFYQYLEDFPPTLRVIGPDSNFSSRAWLSDFYQMVWAHPHPNENEYFPGIANSWAISPERKTVYVRIDPAARWTDGEPITSDDVLFSFYFYLSDYVQAPFTTNFFRTEYTNVTKYDDHTFSISVPTAKPDMADRVLQTTPTPQHFYREFGEDFPERYQWRYAPHAGAYYVDPDEVDMGTNIIVRRLEDWWAKDRKHWRYRFNTDRINLSVIRDDAKRFEAFARGDLDMFGMSTADLWYDRLPDDDRNVAAGYIHKNTFYNGGARSNWGLWINSSRPLLDNGEVRLGIQYAANWDLVISNYFRGDMQRLKTQSDGYPDFSHPTLTARPFDIDKALEHFANAGFSQRGPDGILTNESGERLAFTLTTHYERYADVFTILKEEARKAGLDLRIEILDGAAGFRKAQEKRHDIYFVSFAPALEMYPRMWSYYHSDNAYDQAFLDDGTVNPERTVKPQTNNLQSVADYEMDILIDEYQDTEDKDRMIELSHQILEMHYDYASFSPGFVEPFYRTAYWRWVSWPEQFNYKYTTYPYELFVHWIDEDIKEETLAAQRSGQSFPARIEVFDQFNEQ